MTNIKKSDILSFLKSKSNIDYFYYHLWNDRVLDLEFDLNSFKKNYIVYILNSNISKFNDFFLEIKEEFITDFFFENFSFSSSQELKFFDFKLKWLFWLKFSSVGVSDYNLFCKFLDNNKLDLNRLFIENSNLNTDFLIKLKSLNNFWNLTFLNFDNNYFKDEDIDHLICFINLNNLNLEYLSLVNNSIWNAWTKKLLSNLESKNKSLRILDLSSNDFNSYIENDLIKFIENKKSLLEIYLRNIIISENFLLSLIDLIINKKTNLYCVRGSLSSDLISKYKLLLNDLSLKYNIILDFDEFWESPKKFYTTIYLKEFNNKYENHSSLQSDSFYLIDKSKEETSYENIFKNKYNFLRNAVNIFLFDISNYNKIYYLLENYNFNYIYLENYHISDETFVNFIEKIRSLKHKKYKINLNSIFINEFQLDYLLENLPENIFYIELTLNKIEKNRERYIIHMLKNSAFVFENMELYKKLFV